jgi:hypothetical protein
VKGSFSTAKDRAARNETFSPRSDVKYLRAAGSSASPRCSEDRGGLFGEGTAGLLDASAMNEANVFAVLDAVDATGGIIGGKEKEDADETGWVDVGGGNGSCGGGPNVKELDGEPNPVNPPNFGDGGGCSWCKR